MNAETELPQSMAQFKERYAYGKITEDSRLKLFFQDLEAGKFWHVIGAFDGYAPVPSLSQFGGQLDGTDTPQQIAERRKWAKDNFSEEQQKQVFAFCLETILNPEDGKRSLPGAARGNMRLLESVVDREDSIFGQYITPALRETIVNGAFWEGVSGSIGSSEFHWVLEKHSGELKPYYIPEGLRILDRNRKEGSERGSDLPECPLRDITRYGSFLSKIDKAMRHFIVSPENFAAIVEPYLAAIFSIDDRFEVPRFEESLSTLMKNPLLMKYLQTEEGEKSFVNRCCDLLETWDSSFGREAIRLSPNPVKIVEKILSGKNGSRFAKQLEYQIVFTADNN